MKKEQKIRVVIADDDFVYHDEISTKLKKEENIEIVGIAQDGETALNLIEKVQPDIVLLDILMPKKDGLWVLEEMKRKNLNTTRCIIVSAMDNDHIVRNASLLGADYYVVKPVQADILAKRIYQVFHNYQEEIEKGLASIPLELKQSSLLNIKSLECHISNLLSQMGISASIKGYHYIRTAVIRIINNENALIGITKGLYPDIAKEYKTTSSKVERAIRHAIESSWKKDGRAVYENISQCCCSHKPTNGQFIAMITEYFRLNFYKDIIKTA